MRIQIKCLLFPLPWRILLQTRSYACICHGFPVVLYIHHIGQKIACSTVPSWNNANRQFSTRKVEFLSGIFFFNVIILIVCLMSLEWNCWGSITVQKTLLSNFIFIRMYALRLFLKNYSNFWVKCDSFLRFLNRTFVTEQRFGFLLSTISVP